MEQRTPGGLVVPFGTPGAAPSGNGHLSASQRREVALQYQLAVAAKQIEQLQKASHHYLALITILTSAFATTAVRLSEALAGHVPDWVTREGYVPMGREIPRLGEFFYCPVRDSVIKCAEDIEDHPFVILQYDGVPR